jgi:hypothetical protein
MPSPELWEQLSSVALLGIERSAAWPEIGEPLSVLVQQRDGAAREDLFLSSAAAWDVYRRAGMLPAQISRDTTTAAAEDRPRISSAADEHLARILAGFPPGVLPEWLELCARAGKRVGERHIPALLDVARKEEPLRATIRQVIGQRGQWLAAQDSDWKAAISDTRDPALWETGTRAQRLALLVETRQREPAVGRQMLEKAWPGEPPDERTVFISALKHGLSDADEPFLEVALDDKRKEVRTVAADLLARLPLSRLSARMTERAKALVKIEAAARSKLLKAIAGAGKAKLVVALPEEKSKELDRDGAGGKSAFRGMGDKAWTLATLLAAAPLSVWASDHDLTPAQLVALAASHEFNEAILLGWSIAAARQRDAAWAAALSRQWLAIGAKDGHDQRTLIADMLAELPQEHREQITADALAMEWDTLEEAPQFTMIQACNHAWSIDFSRTVCAAVRRHVAGQKTVYQYTARQAIERDFGRYINPAIAGEIVADPPAAENHHEALHQAVDTMIATVQFRHAMQKELSS